MKAARAKFNFQAQSPKWVPVWADIINMPLCYSKIRCKDLDQICSLNSLHIVHLKQTFRSVNCSLVGFPVACLIIIIPFLLQGAHAAKRRHCLHPQAGWCQLVWRRTSWQSWHFPHILCGGKLLHLISVLIIYDPALRSQISFFCPSQILAPSEKPTPIRSPTLQVLDYGEAIALFNFNADLPVELSFRKVSITVERKKYWRQPGSLTNFSS